MRKVIAWNEQWQFTVDSDIENAVWEDVALPHTWNALDGQDGGHKGIHFFNPYFPRLSAQCDNVAHGKATMLRTERYKFVSRLYESDELYDLEEDPTENINRIDDPALGAVKADLQYKLMKWYQRTADVVPFDFDARISEDMVWAKIKRWVPAECEAEFRQRIHDGASQYELAIECRQRFGRKGE